MSYNIQNIKIIKNSKAYMVESDIQSLINEFGGDLPECCFLSELINKSPNKNGKVYIDNLSWCYTWSGNSYDEVFLAHVVPKIHGKIEAVLT